MSSLGYRNPYANEHTPSKKVLPKPSGPNYGNNNSQLFTSTSKLKDNKLFRKAGTGNKIQRTRSLSYLDMAPVPLLAAAPAELKEALNQYQKLGAGGIGSDFPQGDLGQPFWFSNIGGNHFPREGFTYRPYDIPIVPFSDQMKGYLDDEDARMGIDFLAAKTTGGAHYFKAVTQDIASYIEKWTADINLDGLMWTIAKELLAFGSCFVRLRVPLAEATRPEDFQILPISSFARLWWTPDRRPLWYEFRGAEYNGYFRPTELAHFVWNPTNAQLLGFGIMAQLTNRVSYSEDTADGPIIKERESLLDIKHQMQNVSGKIMKRYLPRNVISAPKTDISARNSIAETMRTLHDSEDIVHAVDGLKIDTINQDTRPIDVQNFMDMFQSSIFKAVGTSKGRIAGQSQGPTYANGEESSILDEIGLAQFPIQLRRQVQHFIVKPWYEMNRITDKKFNNGALALTWDQTEAQLEFGKQSKKDLLPEELAQWAQILGSNGVLTKRELRNIAQKAGVPELMTEIEGEMNLDELVEPMGAGGEEKGGIGDKSASKEMKSKPLSN